MKVAEFLQTLSQAEWLLESQKDVQLLPGPESGHEHPNDSWRLGDGWNMLEHVASGEHATLWLCQHSY